jgi:hypothetical protein
MRRSASDAALRRRRAAAGGLLAVRRCVASAVVSWAMLPCGCDGGALRAT